jgi:phosphatidylglycerophosphatase C
VSAPGRPGVAAFDVDGTLLAGDSLAPFLGRLLGRRRATQVVAASGPAMLAAYRTTGRDGAKAVLIARALTGLPVRHVAAEGERYGRELATQVRPAMAGRLSWHRDSGHRVIIVSASLAFYLDAFGRQLGVDQVIATRLEEDGNGHLTGRLLGPNVRGAEKAARLSVALGDQRVELWAYGDSPGDREMLAMADHPHLVGGRRARPRAPRERRVTPAGRARSG